MELAELSSAPLPDSRFEVPADYQSAPMEELIGHIVPLAQAAGSLRHSEGGEFLRATQPPLPPGVVRVGNGVTAPLVIYK